MHFLDKTLKSLIIFCFVSIALCVISLALYLTKSVNITNPDYLFVITKGSGVEAVTKKLSVDNVVDYPWLFRLSLVLLNKDNKMQAGEYELVEYNKLSKINKPISIRKFIKKITTGDVKQYSFRINEAETIASLINRLKNESKLKKIISADIESLAELNNGINNSLNNKAKKKTLINKIIGELDLDRSSKPSKVYNLFNVEQLYNLEGLFYPDTYYYTSQDTDKKILNLAYISLMKKIADLWQNTDRTKDGYYKAIATPYEALILASMLEKETANIEERGIISGVIYNRLNANMPLQIDPTVIYALGNKYTGSISKEDLSYNSLYNTYVNKSLPPGPIGTFSISSLTSAINPAKNDYLYFVAKGDGTHYFSKTLEEHNLAVSRYIKNNR